MAGISKYKASPGPKGLSAQRTSSLPGAHELDDADDTINVLPLFEALAGGAFESLDVISSDLDLIPVLDIPDNLPSSLIADLLAQFKSADTVDLKHLYIRALFLVTFRDDYVSVLIGSGLFDTPLLNFNDHRLGSIALHLTANCLPFASQDAKLIYFLSLKFSELISLVIPLSLLPDYLECLHRFAEFHPNILALVSADLLSILGEIEIDDQCLCFLYWTLASASIASVSLVEPFLCLPCLDNKAAILARDFTDETTCAFLVFAGRLLHRGLDPFGLHPGEIVPMLQSPDHRILSAAIWLVDRILAFSDKNLVEFAEAGFEVFARLDGQFAAKQELATLFLGAMAKLDDDHIVGLFVKNARLFADFLEMDDEAIAECCLKAIWNVMNAAAQGTAERLAEFLREVDASGIGENVHAMGRNESEEIAGLAKAIEEFWQQLVAPAE
jgi:hypothetical protein